MVHKTSLKFLLPEARVVVHPNLPKVTAIYVWYGNYADDLDESGTQIRDWFQCTSCKKWMHEDCASKDEEVFNCVCLCGAVVM